MRKNIILLGASLILIFGSCEKFLDKNDNPNYPKEVSDELLLPAVQSSMANVFSADYGLLGGFWAQYWAQNNTSSQYKTYETYTLSGNAGVVDRSYREWYFNALADNELMMNSAEESENWGLYLMGATMKAFMFQYLVDLYDNVPYSEAFKGEEGIINPKIDDGETVYDSIYTLVDKALKKDLSGFIQSNYADYDQFYEANINKWVQFANTLKLRLLLRQYDAKTSFVQAEITDLLANAEFLTSDVALTNFEDADSKSNPLYESDQRQLNTSNNIRACYTFVSYLNITSDPRINYLFEEVDKTIRGMIPGSYEVPSTEFEAPDIIAKPAFSPTMPVYLMTVAEAHLLLAEANLRLGNLTEAEENYELGVTSSYERMEIADTLITDALENNIPYPSDSTFDQKLEAIIMQKWVDAADGQRGIEAFIEWVRTGYPNKSAVSADIDPGYQIAPEVGYIPGTLIYSKKGTTGGNFPVRLPYPDSEVNYNSNAAKYKSLIDADVMQTKVWWNK